MTLPELDAQQRREALAKAAHARRVRAELKQMLKAGEVSLPEVLDRATTSPQLAKMRVSEVIEAMPNYGKARASALMEELSIAPSRRLQGLGRNQREALRARFDGRR